LVFSFLVFIFFLRFFSLLKFLVQNQDYSRLDVVDCLGENYFFFLSQKLVLIIQNKAQHVVNLTE